MGDNGTFFCETLDMFCLAREERLGDEEREIGILGSRLLEHTVQLALHLLPDGVAVRLDDHTSAHSTLFGEVGFHNEVVVPLTVVL